MADTSNDDEKIEPTESSDPGAATGTVDSNAVSMDKQGPEDIPEKDEPESLPDEVVEQPREDSEPESLLVEAEETTETASEPEEEPPVEEPAPLPAEPEEAIEVAVQPVEEPPVEEPAAAVEEEPEPAPVEPEEAMEAADQPAEEPHVEESEEDVEEEPAELESIASLGSQPIRSSKLLTAALLLSIVAVVSAAAAGFYFRMLKVELDGLRQQMETTAPAPAAAPAESSRSGQLDRLNRRVEELGERLEVYGKAVTSTGEDRAAVKARIEKIEQSMNTMRLSQKAEDSVPPQTTTAVAPDLEKAESPPAFRKGDWLVNLASYINEIDADRLVESYRRKGLPVEKFSVKSGGIIWHRLRVTGFSSAQEAEIYIMRTAHREGFSYAWMEQIQ
jgi:hypothetical protein